MPTAAPSLPPAKSVPQLIRDARQQLRGSFIETCCQLRAEMRHACASCRRSRYGRYGTLVLAMRYGAAARRLRRRL